MLWKWEAEIPAPRLGEHVTGEGTVRTLGRLARSKIPTLSFVEGRAMLSGCRHLYKTSLVARASRWLGWKKTGKAAAAAQGWCSISGDGVLEQWWPNEDGEVGRADTPPGDSSAGALFCNHRLPY